MLQQLDRLSTFAEYKFAETLLKSSDFEMKDGYIVLTPHQWVILTNRWFGITISTRGDSIKLSQGPPVGIVESIGWCTIL